MKLTTIILTHTNPQLTSDTVDSAETWVGNQTLLLVDKIGWPLFKDLKIGNSIIEEGFLHAHNLTEITLWVLKKHIITFLIVIGSFMRSMTAYSLPGHLKLIWRG
jgi:hypothetical protein